MSESERFNPFHAKAGSPAGGQFASSNGGGGSQPKPSGGHTAQTGHGTSGHGSGTRQQLLEQAHHDLAEAATLEKQLHTLERQHHAAVAAAKHSAAQAAASKKAGHTIQHHHHTAAHKHHKHHAATITQRISSLRTRIHDLRQHAAELEKKAHAMRAAGIVTNPSGTERLHEYWVHGEGAAKIRWGAPGDFDRCVLHLGKYIRDPQGYCNLAHHAATGMYPAQHAAEIRKATGRSQVTTPDYDADGLDSSWDDDHSDLPDLTGLDVHHFEEAARELGLAAPDEPAQRAMPKLGTGARFTKLKASLAAKGAHNPGALAAYIGRKKFGKGKFAKLAAKARGSHRANDAPLPFVRSFPLQDISIRAGGDGRTVDAYATVFDTPAPIRDQDGDYIEVIDRRAFDRILPKLAPSGGRSSWRVGVFYNHAMNLHGQPSDIDSMPIGVPLEIRADDHGLFTRTRYHKGERADQVLEAIREGSLSGYSFSGRFDRSQPRPPRGGFRPDSRGNLPTVRRTESTLREYGPTPFPAYQDAAITGVRSEQIMAQLDHIAELLRSGAPLDSPHFDDFSAASEDRGSASEDSHQLVRSGRSVKQEMQAARAAFLLRQHRR